MSSDRAKSRNALDEFAGRGVGGLFSYGLVEGLVDPCKLSVELFDEASERPDDLAAESRLVDAVAALLTLSQQVLPVADQILELLLGRPGLRCGSGLLVLAEDRNGTGVLWVGLVCL